MTSTLLKQYNASNPVGEQRLITLEIAHSAIVTSIGAIVQAAGYLRLAQSFSDQVCAIDTSSPPATATFVKSGFGFSFPPRNTTGHQDLTFQIDNVSREAWQVVKAVSAANRTSAERAILTLRVFLMSDLAAIAESYTFTAKNFEVNAETVVITGVFHELVNRRMPRRLYDPVTFPGLKYL